MKEFLFLLGFRGKTKELGHNLITTHKEQGKGHNFVAG
jgi:hypothetical protein